MSRRKNMDRGMNGITGFVLETAGANVPDGESNVVYTQPRAVRKPPHHTHRKWPRKREYPGRRE